MAEEIVKKKKKSRKKRKVKYVEVAPQKSTMTDGLRALLPESAAGQILTGIVIGGALTYVLADDKLREKIIRMGVQGAGNVMGTLAELREQIGDIQAEIAAGQTSDE